MALWKMAEGMGLVQHQEHTGGNATIDINHVVRVLAERDGGHVPGRATYSFIRSIEHGATGLATYLPDCSLTFLRRYPFYFVGRTEAMTADWASLWRPRHAPALGHTHQFQLPYPRRLLAPESRAWLRAFYADDLRCVGVLEAAGHLPAEYVRQLLSEQAQYAYWAAQPLQLRGGTLGELHTPPPLDNGLQASRASALARPNILVYLQDDTDLDYLSVYPHGQPKGSQPNLERLAREGMVFDAALSASPLCVPSRYVYLTGRYPSSCYSSSCRADTTRSDMQHYVQLEEDKSNIGALLAAAGYTTGFVGKVHVAPLWTSEQKRQWKLTSDLLASGGDATLLQAKLSEQLRQNELRAREVITKEYGFTWAKNLYDENMRWPFEFHNPDWTLAAAREFLERHRHGRFYLHVCTTLMHGSIRSLQQSLPFGNISGAGFIHDPPHLTPRDTVVVRAKLAGVEPRFVWMDDCVGYLLASLDELRLSNSTLLVFAADHGSRYKGSVYRAGAVQVPMLMRWPARIAAGARVSELVSTVDLVPTWLELAGVDLAISVSLNGYSIAPLLLGARHFAPRKDVYVEMGVCRAIHTKLWTLVVQRPSSTMLRHPGTAHGAMVLGLSHSFRTGGGGSDSDTAITSPSSSPTNPSIVHLHCEELYYHGSNASIRSDQNLLEGGAPQEVIAHMLDKLRALLRRELSRSSKGGRPYGEYLVIEGGDATPCPSQGYYTMSIDNSTSVHRKVRPAAGKT